MTIPVVVSWSGGKDSALTLQALRGDGRFEPVALLTSITREYERVSVHGVRRSLLEEQAESVDLPVFWIELPVACSNDDYVACFMDALRTVATQMPAVRRIAFGDLFLRDVREYRETMLKGTRFEPLFPLWEQDTRTLAHRFVADGFDARLVCIDTTQLDGSFAGRRFDSELLNDLPSSVDPCGERGEFHTFVSMGPGFRRSVRYTLGDRVLRDDRFMYCDLLPERR